MNSSANTIPAQIRASAARYGSAQAVSDGSGTLTFAGLAASAQRIARALLACGVAPGDRVAIWAPNSQYFVRMTLGVQYLGAVVVPINTRYRAEEAHDLLARTEAVLVLVHSGFLGFDYRAALSEFSGALRVVVDLGESSAPAVLGRAGYGWDEFDALAEEIPAERAVAAADLVRPGDLAEIIFTSGTTGRSKGVTVAHGPLLELYRNFAEVWGLRAGDRYLVTLPMFHAGGLNAGLLTSLIQGVTIVPMAVVDTVELMKVIERERISVMNGPPTMVYAILDHPGLADYDLSSLRTMATGAAVVPVEMVERAQTELPFEHFITAYGMTECYGLATMCRSGDSNEIVANTNGRAVPGVRLRVVDDNGADAAHGTAGEVLISGPNITPGYWREPALTAATVVDGWLRSGDIGTLDEHGNLKIVDRLKDLFLVGGFNVSPAEIEQLLARHPAVGEVAVVGVPDERLGEAARAYIMRSHGDRTDEAEIIAWCRERIANFKVPRSIVFLDELPRNASGKVLKGELRESATRLP